MDRLNGENPENPSGDWTRDAALMRRLAEAHAPKGRVVPGLDRAALRRLEALIQAVHRLRRTLDAPEEALSRLDSRGRVIGACARQARAAGGARLPAWGGRPRIEVALEALCAGGAALTRERLLSAIAELDAAQTLTQAELWAVPQALRTVLARGFLRVARMAVARGRRQLAAARWAVTPGARPLPDDPAFFACALRTAAEAGLPGARRRLDGELMRRGLSPESVTARDQAEAAALLLRLDALLAGMRVLDDLDWQKCFASLSQVERTLREDPSEVYPRMDADSRAAVRAQVAGIARALHMPEPTLARCALDAARQGEGLCGGVCWWLYDDAGRRALLERLGLGRARLRKMVPDPTGRGTVAALVILTAAATALLAVCVGTPWLWAACLPLGWCAADALIGRFYSLRFLPARLLKLKLEAVPDACRTLLTLPVLLSSPERVKEVCDQLEALGCLERDENLSYLLLGDLPDAEASEMPGDGAILDAARKRIAELNARAGRERYAVLCRARTLHAPDNVWMGRDRKRGALMDLNRLLLGAAGAEDSFAAEGAACARLSKRRFAYVITLDADTRLLPGDARRLIGAMAHPLNRPDGRRGYAVLQPRVETTPSACVNAFVRLFAGAGGVNAYPVTVSNLWQDLTGRGIYAGKGIYDVAAFQARLEGALPPGRVLSHDLIEGALAGAGFVGDVAVYDGHPTTLAACLARRHRWTRGDWQLLPLIFKRTLPNGARLTAADRFRMLDDLARALRAPALLLLFTVGAWTGGGALAAALFLAFLEPLLNLWDGDGEKWRRAVAELATLPALAWCALDAVGRTLWRLGVSGRRLLEWVTAADAESKGGQGRAPRLPGRVAALLLAPGLLSPEGGLAALALGGLFLIAPAWIGDMQSEDLRGKAPLSADTRGTFEDLARRTWRFFSDNVPFGAGDGSPLPPDNVQLDPPVGAARRTSPTNIALYLLSGLAAHRLGLVGVEELRGRVAATAGVLERLEKWRGQLYNWYDIDTLEPLRPRSVSSVDSGNLAAALLLCANAKEIGAALGARLEALARGMDLAALYDDRRELFFIGMDAQTGRPSAGHYDLLASEARILSYVAMMLGQVPVRHWARLGRPCARCGGGVVPLSWSGTMFEYLMPLLFMDAPPQTLLGEGVRAAARAQMAHGARMRRPWGASESGFNALDAALNYQYRAFGLPELALDGEATDGVVAPYASALAAMVVPEAAADNLRRMAAMGWSGEWGMIEAADYQRPSESGGAALVKSHMAHHQGMALCALCNVLTGDSLRRDFMSRPEARALALLLEERAATAGPRRPKREARWDGDAPRTRVARRADPDAALPETHFLFGGGATALCGDDGSAHYRRGDRLATRFAGALQNRADAARTYLTDVTHGRQVAIGGAARFEPGAARFSARLSGLRADMTLCLSPEDGTLLRVVEVVNMTDCPVDCAVTDAVPVALAREADWQAHAVFQNLFVESARPESDLLRFVRRPGSPGADGRALYHLAAGEGEISCETDYEALAGRLGDAGRATAFDHPLSGTVGATLNPASALRVALRLEPGASARVCFALCLPEGELPAHEWRERWRDPEQARRCLRLAAARAETLLDFSGLTPARHQLLQRLGALLADGTLAAQARGPARGEEAADRAALWPLGLGGERPMLALFARGREDREAARELIRAHGFYRAAGLEIDLVLVDDGGAGYDRPARDMLEALVASSHLNRLRGAAGGVWIVAGDQLPDAARRALRRYASAAFVPGADFYAQVRALVSPPATPRRGAYRPMPLGAPTFADEDRLLDNGFGGFAADGGYSIDVRPNRLTPAPWCNVLSNARGGMLLSERGGGFFWRGNSRTGRLTPYGNDGLHEGWGLMLYLVDDRRRTFARLLPGNVPQAAFRVRHDARRTTFTLETEALCAEVRFAMARDAAEVRIDVTLENRVLRGENLRLVAFVEWMMGESPRDAVALNPWEEGGACFATGAIPGVGWLAAADALTEPGPGRRAFLGRGDVMAPEGFDAVGGEGWTLSVPLTMSRGRRRDVRLGLGWAEDVPRARARVAAWRGEAGEAPEASRPGIVVETPDAALNALVNGFLIHQVRDARVLGRAGLYQPGGAWGFRDQLQDVLALMHGEPEAARAHLLRCAVRQFEAGDVLHWWHEPFRGVRTRVSDDLLFLPWAAAAYVVHTGDAAALAVSIPFLEDVEIPEGQSDIYCEMRPGDASDTLHGHCMRAFHRADRRGRHGLLLMGAGDWNDGMNRVGMKGRGESVWLTQFAIACAERYRSVAPVEADRVWLWRFGEELRRAVEAHGWDGDWYLRAYDDAGAPLGGAACPECQIDAISQAWAALAGLDGARCRRAMDAAWARLVDEEAGLIRLLTPPFDGAGTDPGYIRGYPPGVRENGGQYTHAALWLLLALIRQGDGARAHKTLRMMLPFNHSDTPEKARVYRVEPYVMAADVYDRPGMRGRGGWTWYTGAAGWMYNSILALLGYERRGSRVRLNALLGDWPEASVTVPFGGATYRLVCDKSAALATLDGECLADGFVTMIDDGRAHEARFPPRKAR